MQKLITCFPKKASLARRTASVGIFEALSSVGYFITTSCGLIRSSYWMGGSGVSIFDVGASTGTGGGTLSNSNFFSVLAGGSFTVCSK